MVLFVMNGVQARVLLGALKRGGIIAGSAAVSGGGKVCAVNAETPPLWGGVSVFCK